MVLAKKPIRSIAAAARRDWFAKACDARGLPAPVFELVFARPRRWRFDVAWPAYKVALEVQGGTFIQGRHSRGPALRKEHEKLNAAAAAGWRVLYCFPETFLSPPTLDTVERTLFGESLT